ncbi:Bax inhibitor-1/YccA family protein [Bacteriovoracales bacterium]|nr:Bax inhibitor-1/YccA family protein [Bacteriovoracales bacterium]
MENTVQRSSKAISEETARFMAGVYKWMTFGILLTGATSYYVSQSKDLTALIFSNQLVYWGLIIVQLGAVFFLSAMIQKISALTATLIYLGYAFLTGLTLSVIFLIYTEESIQHVFFLTSFSFAGLSFYGYVTKRDLGPLGTFCHMGLWGLIGYQILSFFFPSLMAGPMNMVLSIVGVGIFAGLTAYDTQKIKETNIIGNEGTEEDHKETIYGALILYLDFINLFLQLLKLFGNRRR